MDIQNLRVKITEGATVGDLPAVHSPLDSFTREILECPLQTIQRGGTAEQGQLAETLFEKGTLVHGLSRKRVKKGKILFLGGECGPFLALPDG
jgi:hypothetical protein